jgi:hypothetical protein
MQKVRIFSWFKRQPITIRAAIVGAILTGIFAVAVAITPILLNLAFNRPRIITSVMDFGRLNRYTQGEIETVDCESTIRLHNIGETAITLDRVEAYAHIGDKSLPTIWQTEYVGSANSVDGIVYYFEITSDLSPISIASHSAVDIKTTFSVEANINQYQFVQYPKDLDPAKNNSRGISVSYEFIFPEKELATTDELFCVYVVEK